ncbi:MAG: insulinase family protein [Candidatus Eisenbacteria bacterium]|nr:insulinase family protein [Candidatus Eisenbacteria bacterium]
MKTHRNSLVLACVPALLLPASLGLCNALALPDFTIAELDNGMTLYVGEDHAVPLVTLDVVLPCGSSCERSGQEDIGRVAAQACLAGVPGKDGAEIGAELRRLGGSTSSWTTYDNTFFSLTSLSAGWEDVLRLLAASIMTPTFPDNEVSRITNQKIAEKRESLDDPGRLAALHAYALLYADGRLSRDTSEQVFRAMSRDDIAAFHSAHYMPNGAFVVAIGDFDAEEAIATLRAMFESWPRGTEPNAPSPSRIRDEGSRVRLVNKPGLTQATVVCIAPGISFTDPDRFALGLASTALGGHFNSRLMSALRIEGGKTYSVRSSNMGQAEQGQFVISTYTRSAETGPALDIIQDELAKLTTYGLTEVELGTARSVLLGRYVIGLETPQQIVGGVARAVACGFTPDDYRSEPAGYESVSVEEANASAAAHIVSEDLRWVIVGDKTQIGAAVRRLGEVETVYYRESPRRPGFFERTRVGIGWTGNTAARGIRLSVLHRWVELSTVYGFGKRDDPWDYDEAWQISLDLHHGNSEYSSSALYAGVTGTFEDDFSGGSPHVGWRLFPNGLGGNFSTSIEVGGSFWDRGGLPGFFLSWTVEQFF